MLDRSSYQYHLPADQIAQQPAPRRDGARLLLLHAHASDPLAQRQRIEHRQFTDFVPLLSADDLLVVNDTKVLPARLFGRKDSGGAVELLLERLLDDTTGLFQIKASKRLQIGRRVFVSGPDGEEVPATVAERQDRFYQLNFAEPLADVLDRTGQVPLPPYIDRAPVHSDERSYQTLFAKQAGAVAAPTAGLHFSDEVLAALAARGVPRVSVTLHVGAGTFSPMRAQRLADHQMHSERIEIDQTAVDAITQCRSRGGRVIAVGTTVVRTLEAVAAKFGQLQPYAGETDIFITPGYDFAVVDGLLTNFHLPESTLLMLVCAFAGYDATMQAYNEAVAKGYRFFSYGDAMFAMRSNA